MLLLVYRSTPIESNSQARKPAEYFRLKCQRLVTSAPTGFNGFVSEALCVLCASALRQFLALNPFHRPAGVLGNQRFGIFGG